MPINYMDDSAGPLSQKRVDPSLAVCWVVCDTWSGLLIQFWLLIKGRLHFMLMVFFLLFYENRTVLKMESNKAEETIKTTNTTHFIYIQFNIPVHWIQVFVLHKCQSEGTSGPWTKFWCKEVASGLWRQVVCSCRLKNYFLLGGSENGLLTQVVFRYLGKPINTDNTFGWNWDLTTANFKFEYLLLKPFENWKTIRKGGVILL